MRADLGPIAASIDTGDDDARRRIADDLGMTLFVDAGAGSGKTTALVNRVLSLVLSGTAELSEVAAITFTVRAAAELRDRLRRELERCRKDPADALAAARAGTALDQLDGAAISTLHGFAERILSEHALDAGLPARLEILDEIAAEVAFERCWRRTLDSLLGDPTLARPMLALLAAGMTLEQLRELAFAIEGDLDLAAKLGVYDDPAPPELAEQVAGPLDRLRECCRATASCSDPGDRMVAHLERIRGELDTLSNLGDEPSLVELIDAEQRPRLALLLSPNRIGKAQNWNGRLDGLRADLATARAELCSARARLLAWAARQVHGALVHAALGWAAERRAAGQCTFSDLLVLSTRVLADPIVGGPVQARCHERYKVLLLDEFQDTDPLQAELALRIAASPSPSVALGQTGAVGGRGSRGAPPVVGDPLALPAPTSGRLFFVGDPKQSIYRFRRADIGAYLAMRRACVERFGAAVELTRNFRSVAPVVQFCNEVFADLFAAGGGGLQPSFTRLQAVRHPGEVGPPVALLDRVVAPGPVSAEALRALEAVDVAEAVATVVDEGWSVEDRRSGTWRRARLGDIAILVPTRTSLASLAAALEDRGVPARYEAGAGVYRSTAVRELMAILRAVATPHDELAIVTALRTSVLGCGDDDLYRYRVEERGSFALPNDRPESSQPASDPVRSGLAYLASLRRDQRSSPAVELLERIVAERRLMELAMLERRPRDSWRRLRFVVDQARAFEESTHGSLRDYLDFVRHQAAEEARSAEVVLPEPDDDAVRILTIHAAKGLEFPVVILSGTTSRLLRSQQPVQCWWPAGGRPELRLGSGIETEGVAELVQEDRSRALEEQVRLCYVACTRARDHLVVSCHRVGRSATEPPGAPGGNELEPTVRDAPGAVSAQTYAELLIAGVYRAGIDVPAMPPRPSTPARLAGSLGGAPDRSTPDLAAFRAERAAVLERGGAGGTVAATALSLQGLERRTPGSQPTRRRPSDPRPVKTAERSGGSTPERPRLDGSRRIDASAFGRAVHRVLQLTELSTGPEVSDERLDTTIEACCAAEGINGSTGAVRRAVDAALATPLLRRAATLPHWRECYFCVPVGEHLLEGYVDLVVRGDRGLVVVDYKTTSSEDPAEIDQLIRAYGAQGAAYALGLETSTGEDVESVAFLFLTPGGALERPLPDLELAVEKVRTDLDPSRYAADGRPRERRSGEAGEPGLVE
jgi:ATP-dependent helicase/nuclease subunit A